MNLLYSVMIFMSIFALGLLLAVVHTNDLLEPETKRSFAMIFIIIAVAAIAEWLGVLMNGAPPVWRIPNIIMHIIDHSLAPLIFICFLRLVSDKNVEKYIFVLSAVHTILEIASAFVDFIFFVDAMNIYHHGPFYWIYFATYAGCSLYFIIESWRFGMRYQTNDRFVLAMMLMFFMICTTAGIVISELKISYLSVAIDTIIFYVYYISVVEKTDGLTGLLNRRSYQSRIVNMRRPTMVLFFDVDNFKSVNDTNGHQFGDEALRIVGASIRAVYGSVGAGGHCYRIGGDEFCALIECEEPFTEDTMETLNSRFFAHIETEREKIRSLPLVSVGYGTYIPGMIDIATAMHDADMRMYDCKIKRKAMLEFD